MRVTDFCNCESRHEHLHERSTLERCHPRFHAGGTPVGTKAPADNSSGPALDGANTSFGSLDHAFSII